MESNDYLVDTFKNEELGLEALVMTSNRPNLPFKAILRDTDADATFAIYFCVDLAQAVQYAKEFTA